ncbi:hypothetical protein BDU57DRAFT_427624, partial [Ampelomyces quisqualis]
HRTRQVSSKPSGGSKSSKRTTEKLSKSLNSTDQYFWYTSLDKVRRLVTCSGNLNETPLCINEYMLDPTKFARRAFSQPLPSDVVWPPRKACDVLRALVSKSDICVGGTAFSVAKCRKLRCQHTFKDWRATMASWQDYFELRETTGRGIGVYTKKAFRRGDILGYYAGEVMPDCLNHDNNDYLMDVPLDFEFASRRSSSSSWQSGSENQASSSTADLAADAAIIIDGRLKGNWTRFINHSCDSHACFKSCRVGDMRIMAVCAVKAIPAGVELTVDYGKGYYGPQTKKICKCGAKNCVTKLR